MILETLLLQNDKPNQITCCLLASSPMDFDGFTNDFKVSRFISEMEVNWRTTTLMLRENVSDKEKRGGI